MMFPLNLLLFAGLSGVALCWDAAVTTYEKINYYNINGTLINSISFEGADLSALAYDAVTDLLLVIGNHNAIYQILSSSTADTKLIVRNQKGNQKVKSLAFDPVTTTLFWCTDSAIYRMNLSDPKSNGFGETVVAMGQTNENRVFTGITIDSCGGYIFWAEHASHNCNINRAKFDGSEATVIIRSGLQYPANLAVDHGAERLYWVDDPTEITYKIESCNFDGSNRTPIINAHNREPNFIVFDELNMYWGDKQGHVIVRTPKIEIDYLKNSQSKFFVDYSNDAPPEGLAVRYNVTAQIGNNPHCKDLQRVAKHPPNMSLIIARNLVMRNENCTHGSYVAGKCECMAGYEGSSCERRSCYICNLQSSRCDSDDIKRCTTSDELTTPTNLKITDIVEPEVTNGNPYIAVPRGNSEIQESAVFEVTTTIPTAFPTVHPKIPKSAIPEMTATISNIALPTVHTEGLKISLSEINPTTSSYYQTTKHTRDRSEINPATSSYYETTKHTRDRSASETPEKYIDNEFKGQGVLTSEPVHGEFVESVECSSATEKDYIIMALGAVCGSLCLAIAVLVMKVIQLKKRPRIKKRIIVNKNVTPLTARPEQQCEITIENCCNMNICETPCFEPRSTIIPALIGAKAKKEEKQSLIEFMADEY